MRLIGSTVYFARLRSSLWYDSVVEVKPGEFHHDFSSVRAQAFVRKAPLSPALAERIRQRYASALARPSTPGNRGFDGTSYQFTLGSACGTAWSLEPQALDGHLAELSALLAAHTQLNWTSFFHRSEGKIRSKLAELDRRFPLR